MALVKISPIHKVACIENVNNVSSENSKRQIDWATQVDLNHLEDEQKLRVMNLLSKYNSVFALNISDLGQCDLIKHEIHLSDQISIRQKPYRVPYHLKPEIRSQINVLLEAGIIQPSTSSFSAPVILVKKSDGSYRLVADLRKLNAKTVPDNYPLPNLTEMIDNLSGAKFFSTLDLTSGFHQMVMHPDHTKYTAIATEFGLFEYKRLPFGLRNASESFQRLMNLVLAGLSEFQISCYIDDLVIAAGSFDEHLSKLEMVFQRLQKANLKVKPSKCSFLKDQITYLGHTVREGQVYPDKKNLDSIREALPPKTKRQVRSFLGLTGFYRKFIPKYYEIALPLTELTKDCNGFKWTEMEQSAFEKLKLYLTSEPCLALPDFSKPFAVCSDASKLALGAVLVQEDETGFLHPIAFASGKLSKAETKFAVVEIETMAIVFAVNHFKNYLFGKHFRIYSDQQCLSKIINYKDPTSRIARWMVTLQQFDYTVIHKPGRLNLMADYLSRASYPNDECVSEKQPDLNTLDLEANIFSVNEVPNSEIIEKQNADAYCCNIKDKLNSNFVFSPNSPNFFLKNNVLLCYTNSKDRHGSKAKLVRRYVASCHSCIQRRGFAKNVNAPVQSIPTADYPFQKVAFDAIGPLVTSKNGNKWIIVISDYFTRYTEAYALPDIQSHNVAKVLIDFISRHGVMQTLHSDRGSKFLSNAMQEVYTKLGISKQQTLAYNPRGNGMLERLNKTIIDTLSHLVSVQQVDWCEHLPFALMAYRNARHRILDENPSFLVYGRDPVMPCHLIFSEKLNQGPYRVIKQNSPVIFQIQHIAHPLDIQTIHLNRLVKVTEREIFPAIEEKSEIVDSPVVTNETNQSRGDTDVSEEFPPLSLPYRSLVNDINLSLRSVMCNTSVDQAQIVDDSVSYDIPGSPNFSSPATSVYDYPNHSTPVSMSNVHTNVSQIQSQGSILQNAHPYNLRPRDNYGMVIYNKH
ncbi:Retrovirus-related Pol polyprotein from transposon 17.6 [Araneus ventricosus]|uniref:RNA-directed DNA polymerase n=1 Tax=Araneus ventricosus TaxID=182803 RepID=A0A4Y2PBB2_ARAVE|nr:Retrovirus-related Pol polyprotein from transposon 17.6 [Araneus ventricosus]